MKRKKVSKSKRTRTMPLRVFALKTLTSGGLSPYQSHEWPLPKKTGRPGAWVGVKGEVVRCSNGIHATELKHLRAWWNTNRRVFVIELEEVTPNLGVYSRQNKLVARRGRLVAEVMVRMRPQFGGRYAKDYRASDVLEEAGYSERLAWHRVRKAARIALAKYTTPALMAGRVTACYSRT